MTPSGMANEMVFHIFSITPWGSNTRSMTGRKTIRIECYFYLFIFLSPEPVFPLISRPSCFQNQRLKVAREKRKEKKKKRERERERGGRERKRLLLLHFVGGHL